MRPHIFLATPCYGGVVTQGYMRSVIGAMQAASGDGYDLTLALLGQDALITRCRNTLVAHFLANPSATHLLFVDGDISFEPTLIGRLLAHDRDVLGVSYPIKQHHWDADTERRIRDGETAASASLRYVGTIRTGSQARRQGSLAAATYVGTGFLLISRAALTRMVEHYPDTKYKRIHAYTDQSTVHPSFYALFDCMIDLESETYLSEDFAFCKRWQDIGGEVWLDTASRLTHTGSIDLCGDPRQFFAQ